MHKLNKTIILSSILALAGNAYSNTLDLALYPVTFNATIAASEIDCNHFTLPDQPIPTPVVSFTPSSESNLRKITGTFLPQNQYSKGFNSLQGLDPECKIKQKYTSLADEFGNINVKLTVERKVTYLSSFEKIYLVESATISFENGMILTSNATKLLQE